MTDRDDRRHPNVINVDEVDPIESDKGRFTFAARRLGSETGGVGLGCSHYEVPPGKTTFPAHWHGATEEAIFVIEGGATLRIGERSVELRAGDFAYLPVGPDHAHQLVNTGDAPLRYLCMSAGIHVDVVGYPDSDKVAALASPPGSRWSDRWLAKWFRAGDEVDYFEGESVDDD